MTEVQELLANTSEPPAAAPVAVVAVDAHLALAVPTAEHGVAPVTFGVFPVSAMRLLVGKGVIGFIRGRDRDRICGLEAKNFELLFEVVVRDETVAFAEVGLEEHNLDFVALALGHTVHNLTVRALRPASSFDGLLLRATTIHPDLADDEFRYHFSAFAKGSKHHHSEIFGAENLLSNVRGDQGSMLAHRVAKFVDSVFDLAVSHLGCVHDLCHGVILSSLIPLYAGEAL